ncbi:hypothetical protein ACI6Q2_02885 [Chitinophagaceae bacterium LWZ2-11]
MRKLYIGIICLLTIVSFSGCGSKGGSSPQPTPEANIAFTTSPVANSNLAPQPIANGLPLTVTITSTMPSAGVRIDVSSVSATSTTPFFTKTVNSTTTANSFLVTGTPSGGISCTCTVTVTSLSTATNTSSSSFTYGAK